MSALVIEATVSIQIPNTSSPIDTRKHVLCWKNAEPDQGTEFQVERKDQQPLTSDSTGPDSRIFHPVHQHEGFILGTINKRIKIPHQWLRTILEDMRLLDHCLHPNDAKKKKYRRGVK